MLKEEILKYLSMINDKLAQREVKGEICLYGGALMCLVYNARPSTKDVDAVFQPASLIREIAGEIACEFDLPEDWLNDGVKGFLVNHQQKVFLSMSHLNIMAADAQYALAMKALSARIDGTDRKDIAFLIRELGLSSAEEVMKIVEEYYPRRIIKPATQFFLEELFDALHDR
ncbi:hypothetical protein JW926_18455 [Candidatus Sumerlaeota bacterium]|nr:hypothetical protein [Candidatus Sumerlaeota bacterium]